MEFAANLDPTLIVEDEPHLAIALQIALQKLGLQSGLAKTLKEATEQIQSRSPRLLILDRKLPDGDSITLCRRLRAQGYQGYILMLTAAGEISNRVEGLQAGADDYLPKPFAWEELAARIESLGRRPRSHEESRTGSLWSLDPARLQVLGPKGWKTLTPLEYRLASHLIHANGAIVSRDQLLRSVWGFTLLPKTRTVDLFIGRLRKAFEENSEEPKHFLTVRGAGYRFQN